MSCARWWNAKGFSLRIQGWLLERRTIVFKPVLRGLPIQWGNNVPVDSGIYSIMVPLLFVIVTTQIFFFYLSNKFPREKRRQQSWQLLRTKCLHRCSLRRKFKWREMFLQMKRTQYILNIVMHHIIIYCYAYYIVILYLYCIVWKFYFYDSKHQIRY